MSIFDDIIKRLTPDKLVKTDNDTDVRIDLEQDGSHQVLAAMEQSAYNFDALSSSEIDLIKQYRRISFVPEVSTAIDEIINDLVVVEEEKDVVDLIIGDGYKSNKALKQAIHDSFSHITEKLLDFNVTAYEKAKDWYVDSRIAFMHNLDESKTSIVSLTQLDVTKLRRVKLVEETPDNLVKIVDDYYVYLRSNRSSDRARNNNNISNSMQMTHGQYTEFRKEVAFKIPVSMITFVDSGLVDRSSNIIYGHLHKSVKAANQLDLVESSSVIHRISRSAPQRVIYVDTGNLNPNKSKTVLDDVKRNMRNETGYDSTRGTTTSTNRVMSLREDIFMTRHSGQKSTEISEISPGGDFDNMQGVVYFKEKLYSALNIPISRFKDSSSVFSLNSEITREELKFHRFITRLRAQFSKLFFSLLKSQLIIDNVIKASEWEELYENLSIRYNNDNHYAQLKDIEILKNRIDAVESVEGIVGKYISHDYVRRYVMMQTDDEIKNMDKQISDELKNVQYGGEAEETEEETE